MFCFRNVDNNVISLLGILVFLFFDNFFVYVVLWKFKSIFRKKFLVVVETVIFLFFLFVFLKLFLIDIDGDNNVVK